MDEPIAQPIELEAAPAPSERAGRAANIAAGVLLLALLAAVLVGWKSLRGKAVHLASTQQTRVVVDWPVLRSPPAGGANVQTVAALATADKNTTTWLPEQLRERVIALAEQTLAKEPDPFSRGPLDAVGAALTAAGWFQSPPQVFRTAPGVVRVHGQWRVPAAVVRVGDQDRLIAWDGWSMPVLYRAGQSRLPVIVGLPAAPPLPAQGEAPEAVLASLELLTLAQQQPWAGQVMGIDAGAYAANRRLALMTKTGGQVVWGGRPSRPLPGEIATSAKLARLSELHARFRQIDARLPVVEIFWQRPLTLDISASGPNASSALPTTAAARRTR